MQPDKILRAAGGRVEAASLLGMRTVPTLTIRGLTDAEKRLYVLADNRMSDLSSFDMEILQSHFLEIAQSEVDVEITGFSTGEVDLIIEGSQTQDGKADPEDDIAELTSAAASVSVVGDCWSLGGHRLICGDALDGAVLSAVTRPTAGPNGRYRSPVHSNSCSARRGLGSE